MTTEAQRAWNGSHETGRTGYDPEKFYIQCPFKLSDAEKKAVEERAKQLGAAYALVRSDETTAEPMLGVEYRGIKPRPFERIRRITGYLTGSLDKWNSAKRAEEKDRVKHLAKGAAARSLLAALVLSALAAGCEDLEDLSSFEWPWEHDSTPAAEGSLPSGEVATGGFQTSTAGASPVYRYGGFKGGGAVEDKETQIGALHMSKSRMSYKWTKGSLKNWGLADNNAGALACAFYWDGKQWIGGKFDWVSTSRTTRDFNNLNGGYGGWNAEAFWSAKKRAFCIVSENGKRRTNLVETTEP